MQNPGKEHLYKVLVIGDLGVGKTSIIKRYVHQTYSTNYRATIGVDFALKVLNWDSETVRLQLWDIAGQERFGNMTRVYYREAMGAFIVFDVTRPTTFEAITKWKEDLDSKLMLTNRESIATVLLANKCDQGREVLTNNGVKMDQFCKDNGFVGWFETSAKVGTQTHAHTYTYAPMCTHTQNTCTHIRTHVHKHMHTHTHPCAQTHAHTHIRTHVHTHTEHMHTHTHPCAHTHRKHAHTYAPMCTNTCTHIHTHVHKHTQKTCTHIHTHVHKHTQKTCTHIRTHVHKHMHTHTHPCAHTDRKHAQQLYGVVSSFSHPLWASLLIEYSILFCKLVISVYQSQDPLVDAYL
uniref:Ras-related protein Rab n=1 Tax=Oncorhynchus mykiss TaxID=8022 RepID=A0A8K9X0H1_ONCMY